MNSATMAAVIAANIAAQNATRSAANTNSSAALSGYPLPIVIATICLVGLVLIVGAWYVQFSIDHPAISAVVLAVVFVLCAMWYAKCY